MRKTFAIIAVAWSTTIVLAQAPAKIDFRRDIVPILETRCFSCHRGNDAVASYRLDLRAELLGETTGRPLVKVGDAANSRLLHVVEGKVPIKLMPRKGPRLIYELNANGSIKGWLGMRSCFADVKSNHWAFNRSGARDTAFKTRWTPRRSMRLSGQASRIRLAAHAGGCANFDSTVSI